MGFLRVLREAYNFIEIQYTNRTLYLYSTAIFYFAYCIMNRACLALAFLLLLALSHCGNVIVGNGNRVQGDGNVINHGDGNSVTGDANYLRESFRNQILGNLNQFLRTNDVALNGNGYGYVDGANYGNLQTDGR